MDKTIFIESGMRLRSESGRVLSPVPMLSGTLFTKRKRICLWLADEAEIEIKQEESHRRPRFHTDYYSPLHNLALDAASEMKAKTGRRFGRFGTHKYYSGPALDGLLFVLFGDANGPFERHIYYDN